MSASTSKPERHMTRWSVYDDKTLSEFIRDRKDVKDIAAKMGRTNESIKARILQHVNEANIKHISNILNMTQSSILYKIAINTGESWCVDQDKWLVKHIQKNSILDTAIRMKRTESEIRDRLEYIAKSYVTNGGLPLVCATTITRFIPATRLGIDIRN